MIIKQKIKIGSKGFTLVETMCSLALLVLVITGFTALVTTSSRMNIKAAQMRGDYETGVENILTNQNLSSADNTFSFTVQSKSASVPISIKTSQTGVPLKAFEYK